MKTRNFLAIALFFIFAALAPRAAAQDNLNALMKKCEMMDDVDVNVVHQRDRKTMKTTQIIRSISIKNNKALVNEFLKAFELDKPKAFQAIEGKQKGKMMPSYYEFADGSRVISYSFSLSGNDGESASVSMIQKGE